MITGQTESFSNMVVRNYFHGTCQKSAPDEAGTWPAETYENSTRYLQFAVAPSVGNSLKVTSISFIIGWAGTTDHMFANTYYSINQTFTPRTQLNTDEVIVLDNKVSALIVYSLNVTVNAEQTFYFRIYPWDNRDVTGKSCGLSNLTIAGTTVSGNVIEQVKETIPNQVERQQNSLAALPSPVSDTTDVPFQMPEVQVPIFPDRTMNIIEHGAVGDGQTMNTKAFANAIQACAQAGGGKVVVPAGVWLTGPIKLESNINLHVEGGAMILFSKNRNDFPLVPIPNPTSRNFLCANPISGYNLENVAITGDGIIDGSGEVWRPMKKEKYTASQWKHIIASGGVVSEDGKMWWPSQQAMQGEEYLESMRKGRKKATIEEVAVARDYLRPNMVVFNKCEKVLLDGPTFQNSPKFNVNPIQCEDVMIRNIKVLNAWNAQNGDGIDIGSCHNVVVSHCMVDVGDDAICLKPSKIEKGKRLDCCLRKYPCYRLRCLPRSWRICDRE